MILSMIVHYRRKFGFTAVLISHDIPDVFFISDRIVILWEGKAGFQGSYEEAVALKHPMIDEFLRSLEGFQDELTGLLSREAFRVHYGAILGSGAVPPAASAALFSVEFDRLQDALGPLAALEVLRLLGEYIQTRFQPIGGFSARHRRDQILTMLPHTNKNEAEKLVAYFARELEQEALAHIQSSAQTAIGAEACFEVYVKAGITDVSPSDTIEHIIEKARARQQIVATHRCDTGGSA
jgi:phospholipid/cholesterol/gamma-HCH transport system ATP-binding protein